MNKNASEEILKRFLLSELLPKFLPHIARTVHEKALRDRVYQKGEYTEQWQGGDIVIFERHIGIVSDRRNKNGVPYVIHHNDPWQTAYEQDILEERTDIVGHYRISE